MPLWGKNDASSNAVLFAPAQVHQTSNVGNATALYNNATPNAYFSGATVGLYGVSAAESAAVGGSVAEIVILSPGSGYSANASVTIGASAGTNATANATANATGRISVVNITNAGAGYTDTPTVAIAAPSAIVFNGNTAISGNTIAITSANSKFLAGDKVTYAGNTTSTPGGLTDNGKYFISFSNSTVIALAATKTGANIALTAASGNSTTAAGATITGETATASASLSGGRNKGALAGWNLRTVGTGGRAGRVQYECLVAMRNITGDGDDDKQLPDS